MSDPKPFDWDNLKSNKLADIKREAKLQGISFPPNAKKDDILQLLVMERSKQDQQHVFSAINSPHISAANQIKQGSKTPIIQTKRKGRPPKASTANNPTFISPLLLGEEDSPKQSPTIKNSPRNRKTTTKAETTQLNLQNQPQEIQYVPKQLSPSPRPSPPKHQPSPKQPSPQPRPSPPKNQPSPKQFSPKPRVQVPEKHSSSRQTPSPHSSSSYSSRTHSPLRYESNDYSSDYEKETSSGILPILYKWLPFILVLLFILSVVNSVFAGLFVIALILYLYLRNKFNNRKSKRNISDF